MAGLGTNEPCWCGSGLKYKKCHRLRDEPVRPGAVGPLREVPTEIERPPYMATNGVPRGREEPLVKAPELIEAMRVAGIAAGEVLDEVGAAVGAGVTTDELDEVAHNAYIARGGYPSTLGYKGYQKSVCTSVNEVICHGIPDDRPLRDGEIVNVDVTIFLGGVHGDTNATFAVGEIDGRSTELVRVTKESLYRGIEAVKPGAPVYAIGRAIQEHAEAHGFGVVRSFCGHAIGREFHGALSIPHYEEPAASMRLEPGMTFTIEPMITMGSYRERLWSDGWTAVTSDGLRTAQFEHTLVVTDDGVEILTPSTVLPLTL
ncbi:MAG: type I methionyl aminopeptidase [Acidimicrobiia bacterium]